MGVARRQGVLGTILPLLGLLALASCGGTPGTTGGDNGTGIGPVLGFGSVSGSVTVIVNKILLSVLK